MVPLLFAAYMELRSPGITPVPQPIPIVHVHPETGQAVTERLAEALDLGSALADPAGRLLAGSATATHSDVRYTAQRDDTEAGGWARFACALFAQAT